MDIVGQNIVYLIDDREKFKIEEDKELFGTSVVKKLRRDGQFLSDINSLDLGKSKLKSVKDLLRHRVTTGGATLAATAATPPTILATTVTTRAAPVFLNNKALPFNPAKRDPRLSR